MNIYVFIYTRVEYLRGSFVAQNRRYDKQLSLRKRPVFRVFLINCRCTKKKSIQCIGGNIMITIEEAKAIADTR